MLVVTVPTSEFRRLSTELLRKGMVSLSLPGIERHRSGVTPHELDYEVEAVGASRRRA
jgi:hypothetical protein